jgi:hypothetical protein
MDTLRQCWDRNKDGAGVMFAHGGELRVVKGMMKWRAFKKFWRSLGPLRVEAPVVLHFRIATHGTILPKNCHPFFIRDNLAFAHNGVIRKVSIKKDWDISDTEMFSLAYLKPFDAVVNGGLTIELLDQPWVHNLISEYIGYSKLVFLDNEGNHTIINESAGTWDDGVWYSNPGYKPPPKTVVHSYTPSNKWSPKKYPGWPNAYAWDADEESSVVPFDDGAAATATAMGDDDHVAETEEETMVVDRETMYCRACQSYFKEDETFEHQASGAPACPECWQLDIIYADDISEDEDLGPDAYKVYMPENFECSVCAAEFNEDEVLEWKQYWQPECPFCGEHEGVTAIEEEEGNAN